MGTVDNSVKDEKTIIGTLMALTSFDAPGRREKARDIVRSLSSVISPSDFENEFYGNMFSIMLGDVEIGLFPKYEAVLGQLNMDDDLPEDAFKQIGEAFQFANNDDDEIILAAKRMREAREIKRAVENATWKTNAEEE